MDGADDASRGSAQRFPPPAPLTARGDGAIEVRALEVAAKLGDYPRLGRRGVPAE